MSAGVEVYMNEKLIGLKRQKKLIKIYLTSKVEADGCILHGPPGTGKTSLAKELAKEMDFDPFMINLADEKQKQDIKENSSIMLYSSLEAKERLTILDECDRLKEGHIIPFLEKPRAVILLCNNIKSLPYSVKKRCHLVPFHKPTKSNYREYFSSLDGIPYEKFQGWRDAINFRLGGDPEGSEVLSPLEEARKIFAGEPFPEAYPPQIQTSHLLWFYSVNGGHPEMVSHVDMLLRKSRWHRRAARDILFCQRIEKVGYPTYKSTPKRTKATKDDAYIPLKILSVE